VVAADRARARQRQLAGLGVIHYHGTPITPRAKLLELAGRCFCVSFAHPQDAQVCHEIGQAVMLDNGAFTHWRSRRRINLPAYYGWCERWLEHRTTWAVIPDVIDGSEHENDRLLAAWPFGARGAPVWHMHEHIDRLLRLAEEWPRVCLGSSGSYRNVGDHQWRRRMAEAMDRLCPDGPAPVWLHMLRRHEARRHPLSLRVCRQHEHSAQPCGSPDTRRSPEVTPHDGGSARPTPMPGTLAHARSLSVRARRPLSGGPR
jgi:hypothetical protein